MRTTNTRTVITAVILLLFGFVAASCGGGDEGGGGEGDGTEEASGGDADGEAIYASSCASCHGPDATGMPKLGKDLTTSAFLQGMTDEEAVTFIEAGRGADDPDNTTGVAMPPKGGNPSLDEGELTAVVAYLRTLEK